MGLGEAKRVVTNKKLKGLGEMAFAVGGGPVNWFPGHMAAATRAIRDRLKLADLVVEVRDARIPFSSASHHLQPQLSSKRRVVALNKKDLANPNIMPKWIRYFDSCSTNQDCVAINAHSKTSVNKLLELVEFKLREVISREPTLLVLVVGVPNVGKSALINSIHQIASSRFPVQEKMKRATVGPLPGVTQDIAGYKVYHSPSIYIFCQHKITIATLYCLFYQIKLTNFLNSHEGSVKDSVVGEERIAQYLLAVLNTRGTPLHWKHLNNRRLEGIRYDSQEKHEYNLKDLRPKRRKPPNDSDMLYVEDLVTEVQCALYLTLLEFTGNVEDESDLEGLIEQQFVALQKAFKIPHKASEARLMVSKKLLTLFRAGKLGPFILDDVPDANTVS
nr:short integuments 2, mitochondrial-like [Quercus suber]